MSATPVGIGILGFGGFAMFSAQQFAQVPGAALLCIAGTHREASLACAARFGLADVQRAEVMLAMPEVGLVYIATPGAIAMPTSFVLKSRDVPSARSSV
jgi:predicted dehydrogenase